MSLLQISINGREARLHGSPQNWQSALRSALEKSPGPVSYLIHGFKYAPAAGLACPHGGLFALRGQHPNPRVLSWPHHLRPGGVLIGLGWPARGGLGECYQRALLASEALAEISCFVRTLDATRSQNVLAHSLGARVALQALHHVNPGTFRTMILLAAAEYRQSAEHALASPAGRAARILHVTSGENRLYDILFRRLVAPRQRGDVAYGTTPLGHAKTLLLDDDVALARLRRMGFRIAPQTRRICHWSPYLRPGVFALYRALIRGDLGFKRLEQAPTKVIQPRWSRFLAPMSPIGPLHAAGDASV